MKQKRPGRNGMERELVPTPSSLDLRGSQSVRATFRLTERAITTISLVASHLGIRQKALFDHFIEDPRSLDSIASRIRPDGFNEMKRIQKTYVLSRKALLCLDNTSRSLDAPRDALVEYSVERLFPLLEEERERHGNRKKLLGEITRYLKQGEEISTKSRKLLGKNDPVQEKLEGAMRALRKARKDIVNFVEKGKGIDAL